MKRRYGEHGNRGIRLLTSAAVLLYTLLPQPGFCACADCHCENKVPAAVVSIENPVSSASESCCCCKTNNTPPKCRSDSEAKQTTESPTSGGSCSCSCSTTKDTPLPSQDLIVRSAQVLEEFKFQFHSIVAFLSQPETTVEADRPVYRFDQTVFRFPVRLHLLLLVLLN